MTTLVLPVAGTIVIGLIVVGLVPAAGEHVVKIVGVMGLIFGGAWLFGRIAEKKK